MRRSVPAVESKPSAANAWALSEGGQPFLAALLRNRMDEGSETGGHEAGARTGEPVLQHPAHRARPWLSTANGDKVTMGAACASVLPFPVWIPSGCTPPDDALSDEALSDEVSPDDAPPDDAPPDDALSDWAGSPQTPSSADLRRAHHALTGVSRRNRGVFCGSLLRLRRSQTARAALTNPRGSASNPARSYSANPACAPTVVKGACCRLRG